MRTLWQLLTGREPEVSGPPLTNVKVLLALLLAGLSFAFSVGKADAYVSTPWCEVADAAGHCSWDPQGNILEPNPAQPGEYTFTPNAQTAVRQPWDGVDQWRNHVNGDGTTTPRPSSTAATATADEAALDRGLAGRLLPAAGRVLPWVGAGVAAVQLCQAISGNCWIFSRDDPAPPPSSFAIDLHDLHDAKVMIGPDGQVQGSHGTQVVAPELIPWRYKEHYRVRGWWEWDQPGPYACNGPPTPPGVTAVMIPDYTQCATAPNPLPGQFDTRQEGIGMKDITPESITQAQAGANPSIPTSSAGWPSIDSTTGDLMVEHLNQLPADQAQRIVQNLAHTADPANGPRDPYPQLATVPDCQGVSFNVCYQRFQDAGFGAIFDVRVNNIDEQIPLPQGFPREVVRVENVPAPGTKVMTDTVVSIVNNPELAGMGYEVPDVRGKTRQEAKAAYDPFGVPASAIDDVTVTLPETSPDLKYGPDQVTSTTPAPHTRALYSSAPTVVKMNPSTAPDPNANSESTDPANPTGAAGACGLTAPHVDFDGSPFTRANLGSRFPFALVPWLNSAVSGIASGSERPNATFSVLGESVDLSALSKFDPLVSLFRLALSFLLWIGVAWFLYGRTIGKDT